jgi:hypothetical protein
MWLSDDHLFIAVCWAAATIFVLLLALHRWLSRRKDR